MKKNVLIAAVSIIFVVLFVFGCDIPEKDPNNEKNDLTGSVSFTTNSPKVGVPITAIYTPGNGSGSVTWQWFRVASGDNNGIFIVNGNTYTPTNTDIGHS